MGSDLTVANAARVSFDKESEWNINEYEEQYLENSRTVIRQPIFSLKEGDKKLINFLARENHWTPFGHCSLQFRIKAPIFVARQLGKHQVGLCLSGDSEITFIKKNKGVCNGTYKRTLSDIWKMWSGQIKYQSGKKGKLNISKSNIRVFNEETNRFEISNIINVIDSGIKKVWLVVDEFGKSIKATEDHEFLTSNGWKALRDINIEDFLISSERGESFSEKENFRGDSEDVISRRNFRKSLAVKVICNSCLNEFDKSSCEVDHIKSRKNGGSHLRDNLQILCKNCHKNKTLAENKNSNSTLLPKYTKVISKIYIGEEQCFDLTIDRIHNFIANGFVVHNCWNEISRRYVDSDPEFYFPEKWRKKNPDKKQGSYDDDFIDLKFAEECQPKAVVNMCRELYHAMIDMEVCAEQARMILPQNMYTEWYWSGTLFAFARVCRLRLKKDTQKETRDIADQINNLAEKHFPISWKALMCKD
jgi:thymidylate synthase (FAD)